jgi:L-gulonate 5-dehydrogenase
VQWLAEGKLQPAAMITQTIPAADAQSAFDLIEREPQRTIKVHLDFAG